MSRKSNAEIVHAALPEMGGSPVQVQRLAQNLPLTMREVTAALQVLKHSGRAINPRGHRTNYWTRYEEPVMEEPTPEPEPVDPVRSDAEARVHEVERHLARLEGVMTGMSSRLEELMGEVSNLRAESILALDETVKTRAQVRVPAAMITAFALQMLSDEEMEQFKETGRVLLHSDSEMADAQQ